MFHYLSRVLTYIGYTERFINYNLLTVERIIKDDFDYTQFFTQMLSFEPNTCIRYDVTIPVFGDFV